MRKGCSIGYEGKGVSGSIVASYKVLKVVRGLEACVCAALKPL